MSSPAKKDAAKAVLVVGSGYGALKAAEDLAHAGIPVVWAARGKHFLELPEGVEPFEQWPGDLNFQFRPLYLRVTRHPLVTPLTQARVEAVEQNGSGYKAVVKQDPVYVDYDLCTGCSRCLEVCPLTGGDHPPLSRSPAFCPSRALIMDKRPTSPCRQACPLGVNAQAYLAMTAAGRYEEALAIIRRDNPLPGVCGYICSHPCEDACRRAELDQPLAIRDIKRFLYDHEADSAPAALPEPTVKSNGRKVAVVGSGPAGLSAAHFLNQRGFGVTIFEAMEQAGGMLRRGINAFRLPRKVIDAEIRALAESGVQLKTGVSITDTNTLLDQGFDAILLATGTHQDLRLNIPGEDLDGVRHCLDFLSQVNLEGSGAVGPRTVVIGGGNSAMDAARTALRLGATEVTVVAIETEDTLPAALQEIREAKEEGVAFRLGLAPVEIGGRGNVAELRVRAAHWQFDPGQPARIEYDSDEIQAIEADTIIVAISQRPDLDQCGLSSCVEQGPGGKLAVDEAKRTSDPRVYGAGDVVTGPSTVVQAMAGGRAAAASIAADLTGDAEPWPLPNAEHGVGEHLPISEDLPQQQRLPMAQRQAKARRRDFEMVDLGYTVSQAQAEASRCLQCGSCCECLACETACADVGAIDHARQGKRINVEAPAIIWAEGRDVPWTGQPDGHKVFRVDPADYSADLMDILMTGSAAAGLAMADAAKLRVAARLKKKHAPMMDDGPMRLGFFVCACNGTMAPAETLDQIQAMAASVPGIVHSGQVFSLCNPRGADQIAAAVAEHKLNRVIMASCVCCPLEFQCISCNDQRTRARLHLFERLGLDRSRFEMINLRDHLEAQNYTPDEIISRARHLLRAAFIRSQYLGPLRQGVTEMGKRVLILGGSTVGLSAARNLALQGLSVRLVHKATLPGRPVPLSVADRAIEPLDGNIATVDQAEILGISGCMGDFSIKAKVDGKARTWKADVVCLTDESVLPLSLYAGETGLKKFYRYDFAFFNSPQTGIYRVMPVTLRRIGADRAGAALAGEVATTAARAYLQDHQLSPVVDPDRCRGCGNCVEICPFEAVSLRENEDGSYTSEVHRHNCVGCGGCVGRCPVTAMDIPYFSNRLLKEILSNRLSKEA